MMIQILKVQLGYTIYIIIGLYNYIGSIYYILLLFFSALEKETSDILLGKLAVNSLSLSRCSSAINDTSMLFSSATTHSPSPCIDEETDEELGSDDETDTVEL